MRGFDIPPLGFRERRENKAGRRLGLSDEEATALVYMNAAPTVATVFDERSSEMLGTSQLALEARGVAQSRIDFGQLRESM